MSAVIIGCGQFTSVHWIGNISIPETVNTSCWLYEFVCDTIVYSYYSSSTWFHILISNKLHSDVIPEFFEYQINNTEDILIVY